MSVRAESFRGKLLSNSSKSSIHVVSLQQTTATEKEMPLQKNFKKLQKYRSICIHWNTNIWLHSASCYWLLFHCVILTHDTEQAPLAATPADLLRTAGETQTVGNPLCTAVKGCSSFLTPWPWSPWADWNLTGSFNRKVHGCSNPPLGKIQAGIN